jgi:hypothetical protein
MINWLSYVTDDPTNPGANVSRYLSGGGAFYYIGYDASAGIFAAQDDDGSKFVRVSGAPITYRHLLRDGSVEIYAQADGELRSRKHEFSQASGHWAWRFGCCHVDVVSITCLF